MKFDMSQVARIGIDKLVLSGIKVESNRNSTITEGQGWIEEKLELKEELFSIVKSIKLYETGEMVEANYLRFNPNRLLHGHNISNARAPELKKAVDLLIQKLGSKGISVDITDAKISEIEININIEAKFEEYKEVLILLFLKLPNLRKIGNLTLGKAYKKLFTDSTLDGGWQNHGVRAYDKRREVSDETVLSFDLLRIEWWLSSSSYKYYASKFDRDNILSSLLEDCDVLDLIFMDLCINKLFKGAYKYLEEEIIPELERAYLDFKKTNREAANKGKNPKRNVYKYLEENYWIFDYSYLIEIVSKHDKKNRKREMERIKTNYSRYSNKQILAELVERIMK
ncbi:hypothetical protein [uncultured Ilyobacter sp.]|jgi:hypothetical protein|uniref:hypothetical protein n=1 Tax=uncultured Ilyobacter sp. TaxID=544433 RepID=UPI0029C84143|nr:hypothetical protein [uncultured Ilyobacter sp.]